MKFSTKANHLRALALSAGAAGFLLRVVLYTEGKDDAGLLITGHWSAVALWVLCGVILLALFLAARSVSGPEAHADSFPASAFGGVGALLGAGGFGLLIFRETLPTVFGLEHISLILSILAGLSLIAVALCRLFHFKPYFLLHAAVCIGYALLMVCRYRSWNSDAQVHNYCFYMMACVCLMLFAYQLAAFDAGMGNHRALWFWGLAASFLCCLASFGTRDNLSMFFWGLWAFSNLSNLAVRPRRQRKSVDLSHTEPDASETGESPC